MAYIKTNWKDYPDTSTPITAEALQNIEDGIEALDTVLGTTSATEIGYVKGVTSNIQAQLDGKAKKELTLLWSGTWAGDGTGTITLNESIFNYRMILIEGNRNIVCTVLPSSTVVSGNSAFMSPTPAMILYALDADIISTTQLRMRAARSYNVGTSAFGVYTTTKIYGVE